MQSLNIEVVVALVYVMVEIQKREREKKVGEEGAFIGVTMRLEGDRVSQWIDRYRPQSLPFRIMVCFDDVWAGHLQGTLSSFHRNMAPDRNDGRIVIRLHLCNA